MSFLSLNTTVIYLLSYALSLKAFISFVVIFKVYDADNNGKVTFNDLLDILRDLTGQFISEQQREVGIDTSHFVFALLFSSTCQKI